MSGESSVPDFEDLLAAFDIPDVTVRIREATTDDDGPATTESDVGGNDEKNQDDSITNNVPVEMDSSSSTVNQNGENQMKESDAAIGTQTNPVTVGQESSKTDQPEDDSKEKSTFTSEAGPVQTPSDQKSLPISSPLSPDKDPQSIKVTVANKPQKIVIRSILTPTSSTQTLGFKNTSSDGPKILNVSSGISNLIALPKATSAGATKPGQVLLKQIVPISTQASHKGACPPAIFRAASTLGNNSKVTVSPVYKPSVGPLYRISTLPSKQGPQVVIRVNQSDPYEEEIRNMTKKQLDKTNPIQTYNMTPPPEDLGIDIPNGGYKCCECGDSYALESSLTQHMERRSVKIVMICNLGHCKHSKLEFYNKCSMHAHIRSHNISSVKPVLNAVVSPLDSLTIGSGSGHPKEAKQQPSDQEQGAEGEKTSIRSLLQQARKRFEDRLPKAPGDDVQDINITLALGTNKCPVCCEEVGSSTAALAAHIQTLKSDQQYSCVHCSMVLVNNCQLQIHTKIHASVFPPWVCPECARVFKVYDTFQEHINHVCLHFHRSASFQCTLCPKYSNKILKSLPAYILHLSNVHKNSFYKCVNCQLAFRSVEALKYHNTSQHSYSGSPLCSIISKCPLCDTVFTQNSMLTSHLNCHVKTFLPINNQFICAECPFVTVGVMGLQVHYSNHHNKRLGWFCDLCLHKFRSKEDVRRHRVSKHKSYASINSIDQVNSKEENENSLTNGADQKASISLEPKQPKATDPPNGKTSQDNLGNDKKESTKVIIKRMLRCPGCKAQGVDIYFKKERNLRNHIIRSHAHIDPNSIRAEFLEYVPFYPGKGNAKVCDQDESGGTDVQVGHKRKRSKDTEAEASANRIKKLREEKLSCAKCDYESKDRIEFSSHIDEHREDDDVSQCQECGTCFRVEDSLHKHLFVRHQIRDINAYGKFQAEVQVSIEKYKVERMKELSKRDATKSPANPLECQVCYKVFINEAFMKSHMRSHGMAFIRAKNKTV